MSFKGHQGMHNFEIIQLLLYFMIRKQTTVQLEREIRKNDMMKNSVTERLSIMRATFEAFKRNQNVISKHTYGQLTYFRLNTENC